MFYSKFTPNIFKFWRWPKKYLVLLIILIIGSGLYYYSYFNKKIEPIQTTTVTRQDIKSTISASGTLNGIQTSDLKFKSSGKLAYISAKEGDVVTKGQSIASLDIKDLNIALQQARNDFLSKDATAKKAEDDVKNHESDETYAQRETRIKAQAARDSAYDAVKAAQRDFEDAVIYSPIAGLVTKTDVEPGQFVSPTDLIAQIVDHSQVYFDAEVDETDIGKISIGQKAEITLNSYENRIFEGVIAEIKPIIKETSSGATIIIVRISLGKPEINFVTGLNGQAQITINESKNVLSIPQEALKDDQTVFVKEGDKISEKKIRTGIKSDTHIEILGGLEQNQEVVINPDVIKK